LALAIDFGSSNTAAAYRDPDGTVHEIRLTTTGALMPSAVLYSNGGILVGRTALQAAFTEPDAFEPTPKRRLADGDILLGGTLVPVVDLVAAVFREVLERAWEVIGAEPDEVILTHPEQWAAQRKQSLAAAAVKAGIKEDRLQLLSEPEAAAWFYATEAADVDLLPRLAVFDFGAGTCDVAVLDRQPDNSFAVVASEGVEGLGGQDLDARVRAWVRHALAARVPHDRLAAVRDTALLAEIDDPHAIATRTALNDRIREAKEALSEAASAAIAVAGQAGMQVLQLTRDEFDSLITADVTRAVRLTKRVMDSAQTRRPSPHTPTIYLTGGSSHIPLVHIELGQLAPLGVLGDPKTVVVQGALHRPDSVTQTGAPTADTGAAAATPAEQHGVSAALSEPTAESGGDSGDGSTRARTAGEAGQSRRLPRNLPRKWITRKWILAGAAVLVIAAVVAIVAVTTGRDRHGTTTVRASQLGSILLSANAVNTAMGTSNIAIDQTTDGLHQPAETISDERCRGILLGTQQPVYQGSGYVAVSDQILQEPGDGGRRVDQAAVGYPWAALARKFLNTSTDNWKACADQSVTVTAAGKTDRWVIGGLTTLGDGVIAQESAKEAGKGLACQHALSAVSNVVLDVVACGDDVGNQAVDIAEKMAANVNR
jgi:PknH-like extracellular domain/Hsp70 protein